MVIIMESNSKERRRERRESERERLSAGRKFGEYELHVGRDKQKAVHKAGIFAKEMNLRLRYKTLEMGKNTGRET